MREAIILFTRIPIPGKTKTRLIGDFSPQEACRIHQILLEKIYRTLIRTGKDIFLFIDPFEKIDKPEGVSDIFPQVGKDLNEKMEKAIFEILDLGYDKVILIGSDIVGLTGKYFDQAFELLDEKDLVFGPVSDGGYCLIGMKKKWAGIFEDRSKDQGDVLSGILTFLEEQNISFGLLEELLDIDDVEDFNRVCGNEKKDIKEFERIIGRMDE